MDSAIGAFAGAYLVLLAMWVWAYREVSAFLAGTSSIRDSRDLERFKSLARRNMYAALLQLPIWLVALVAGVVIMWRYGLVGCAGIIAVNSVGFRFAARLKKLDVQSRSLPAASPELQQQHAQIGHTWLKRALPDF